MADKNKQNFPSDFYRLILDNHHDGIWVTNADDCFIYFNPGMEKIAGVEAEEVLGLNITKDFPPDTTDHFLQFYYKAKESLHPQSYEARVMTPTGRHTIQSGWLSPRLEDGEYAGMICTIQDVTEKILAREQLRHERDFSKLLLDTAQSIILVLNPDGTINSFNPYMEKISGYKIEEVQGKDWFETFLPNQDWQRIRNLFITAINDIEVKGNINPIITKEGRELSIEWYAKTLKDQNGKILGLLSIGQDVTDRIEWEEKLKVSQALLNKSQEIAHLGSWHLDIKKNILTWSDENYRIFGRSKDSFKGTYEAFLGTVHPDDRKKVDRTYKDAIKNHQPYECIHRIIRNDGEVRTVHEKSEDIVDENGETIHSFGFTHDITERVLAEKEKDKLQSQLQQAVKMQAVGTMAGGIAHEFNNLLGVIMGCADMARDDVPKDSFAKIQLDKVMTASYRVKDLVKQILTFSRQSQQKRISANLCPLINDSLKLIQSSMPSSVKVNQSFPVSCDNVLVDPTEIQQIIMNLCSNAVWAMKERGVIEISLHQIQLDDRKASVHGMQEGSYIEFIFSDTGQGMDEETKSKIFDPFFTRKEVGEGTGMGLSIVFSIMESYGGTITVESEVGKGATFHLYFPITDKPAIEKPEKTEDGPNGKGTGRILFVDDEKIYAEMGSEMIKRLGYDVDLHTDSMKALEVFKASPESYNLVITDQIMPDLSGEELVKEIRSIKPEIPVILCTGYSSQMDDQKSKALGINAFAFKPIMRKDFAALIRKVLDSS